MYRTCGEELYAERSSPLSKLQCKHVCFGFFLQEIVVSTFVNNRSFVESYYNIRVVTSEGDNPCFGKNSDPRWSISTERLHMNDSCQLWNSTPDSSMKKIQEDGHNYPSFQKTSREINTWKNWGGGKGNVLGVKRYRNRKTIGEVASYTWQF